MARWLLLLPNGLSGVSLVCAVVSGMLRFIYSRLAEWLPVVVGRILSFFLTNYSSSVDFWLALFAGSTVVGSAGAGGGGACWSDGVAVVRRRLLPPLVFAGSR